MAIQLKLARFIQKSNRIFSKLSTKHHACTYSTQDKIKWSYFHNPGKSPFLTETVGQILDRAAEQHANKEAVVFCEENIKKTYAELKHDVDKLAAGLLAIGLAKGDRLGIWSPNYYKWIVTQFACVKAGLILVTLNPAYQPPELEYCLKKAGVRAIVAAESFKTQDYYKLLTTVVESLSRSKPGQIKDKFENLSHVIMMSDKKYEGAFNFSEVSNCAGRSDFLQLQKIQETIQFDDCINIQFTSGTTGFPKGVTLTHFNVVNNCFVFGKNLHYHETPPRVCLPIPLFHAFCSVTGVIGTVMFGGCQVYPGAGYNPAATMQAISDEKCTVLYGTPTIFIDALGLPNLDRYDLSHLEYGLTGGAVCPVEMLKNSISKFKLKHLCVAYGSTECSPAMTQTVIEDSFEKRTTTVGKTMEHTEVKIVDTNTLRVLPIGEIGEIWTRGYLVMKKYWNDPEKTNEAITEDGWYRSGDLACADDEGYIKIAGRVKEMIIRGGENIYPREIEEFLHKHPKIADAHVFGVPDKRMGEEVCAWVRLKTGETITENELKDACKGQMSHFKIPRYVKFVDSFPMTTTGKVRKDLLRDWATTELKLNAEIE